ncbi:OLC1v1011411C3 [Oldenlandia corymbosa var. corymbosa]|uniref:OLC1v1011411C3 n=1 Tax=Oldenlandia corymbosa var. corymbosa TaxID=529605 RepID=A0AAV1DWL0_OLDCO|nr:OLC1v1011411C3 [Oldenlandia corymbosa var. corymbosa]
MASMITSQALKLTELKSSPLHPVSPSSHGQVFSPPLSSVSVNPGNRLLRPLRHRTANRPYFAVQASSVSGFDGNIGDLLGDVSIFTASGQAVKFQDLWDQNEGLAVVALLRHFGCPCCWELASVLKESKEIFDSSGVKLIAVGVGAPNKARILAERLPFPMDCLYADPDRKAYDVLGLYYGFGRTFFNPASAKVFSRYETLRNAVKNYTIEATPDDRSGVLQQVETYPFVHY